MRHKTLVGKTIKSIKRPDMVSFSPKNSYQRDYYDDNIVITFEDGTVWKLASWDYEGYSSGIDEEITTPSTEGKRIKE